MFVLMSSRSSSKHGHLRLKTRSPVKSKEDLVKTLQVTLLNQSSWILLKMLVLIISRSSAISCGTKLGHQARSKENLVNTLVVTFFFINHHESCLKYLS